MAHDDYHAIVYRVLAYLYECFKAGKKPTIARAEVLAEVGNRGYWQGVVKMMYENGYIDGISLTRYKSGGEPWYDAGVGITEKGITYLAENALMKKAAKVAGEAFAVAVQSAVQMAPLIFG
jgi:hypothetical protein